LCDKVCRTKDKPFLLPILAILEVLNHLVAVSWDDIRHGLKLRREVEIPWDEYHPSGSFLTYSPSSMCNPIKLASKKVGVSSWPEENASIMIRCEA
jgi:hypothetical protein